MFHLIRSFPSIFGATALSTVGLLILGMNDKVKAIVTTDDLDSGTGFDLVSYCKNLDGRII